MKRMDRYKDSSDTLRVSRSDTNKELYESVGSNTRYASFTDVTNANAIDLSSKKNSNTREGYHQMKEYQTVTPTPRVKKDLEDFKSIYIKHENRVYDINSVLEEARKNRIEKDILEEKRKLKNTSYNIIASLNPEELEKYREEKRERLREHDEDELRDMIDTITSATLAGDLKVASDLLSDLMATSIMEKVNPDDVADETSDVAEITEVIEVVQKDENTEDTNEYKLTLSKEIKDLQELKKITDKYDQEQVDKKEEQAPSSNDESAEEETEEETESTEEFYTRSMDLSNLDIDMDEEFKDKKMPLGIKILIFLIILIILAAVFYFIWRMI